MPARNQKKRDVESRNRVVSVRRDPFRVAASPDKVFTFVRTADLGNIASSFAGPVFGSNYFSLDGVTNYSEFSSLFDQFRIKKIRLHISPLSNAPYPSLVAPSPLYIAPDFDNATLPASVTEVIEKSGVRILSPKDSTVFEFTPRIAVAAYQGALTAFANQTSWVDCSYHATQFYGIKYALPVSGSASQLSFWHSYVEYLFEFRNVQ